MASQSSMKALPTSTAPPMLWSAFPVLNFFDQASALVFEFWVVRPMMGVFLARSWHVGQTLGLTAGGPGGEE